MATVSPLGSLTEESEDNSEEAHAVDAERSTISNSTNSSSNKSVGPLHICLRWIDYGPSEYSSLNVHDRRWIDKWRTFDSGYLGEMILIL